MELSPNQEKIVSVLSDNHDGLGFNDLKKATGLHTKVLNDNLKKLEPEVVTKNKAGVERWQRTNYKLTIDPDFLKVIERSFAEIEDFEKKFDLKDMNKREQYACLPLIINGIGSYLSEVLLGTMLLDNGDILFQTYQKKFLEHMKRFKDNYLEASGVTELKAEQHLHDLLMVKKVFPMLRYHNFARLLLVRMSAINKKRTLFDYWQDLYIAPPRILCVKSPEQPDLKDDWKDEIINHELTPQENLIEEAQWNNLESQLVKNVPDLLKSIREWVTEYAEKKNGEYSFPDIEKTKGKHMKIIKQFFGWGRV